MSPSTLSVIIATHEQRPGDAAATAPTSPPSTSSAQPKNGTITIRSVVSALGRFQLLGVVLGAASRHAAASATRSAPSEATTTRADDVADPGARGQPGHGRRTVDLRALVRGAALGLVGAVDRDSTSTSTALADPVLGALGR